MIPKFRAWDKECMEMANVTDINYKGNWVVDEPYVALDTRCDLLPFDDVELMQSTGLKDKNGVEIFEGDVVLADGVKKIVTFGEQEHEEDFGDLIYYIGFNVYTKMGYSLVIPVEYEVIGNIYENSELLEEQL
ncbi:YopX family protein [Enterococcus hirae]|uniref:YopX family protein n=1 Tax=Enterococcus TaxID=1350 RepID=UPI001598448D|nr:YopX family protein [Enterococcus hirae]EMF0097128.1 hypothetical protein [Enterococcus hirae]EMF0221246.1 hypothetical protein [Enterococcus hirae]EMF0239074.1 hypothetical protein [Enterococcus hirae]QKX68976.1 hypothetical protein HU255_07605 [Enterococcus hirae]